MTPQPVRRGFDPDDIRQFSDEALPLLQTAQEEMCWLMNRGYPMGSVTELVGGHHQLTARQRIALQRATATERQCAIRQATQMSMSEARGRLVLIDGFNLIITLEVALSGSILILGMDRVIRDLAGLRGTYRLITQTEQAIALIGQSLAELDVSEALFYLDANVSNSGRLRRMILDKAVTWMTPVSAELVPNADTCLKGKPLIVTGDSFVIDACQSWINLSARIVMDKIPNAWIVQLHESKSGPACRKACFSI